MNSKANKREGSGRYRLKTTSYLNPEHTYEAESADHAIQLRPWFLSCFPSWNSRQRKVGIGRSRPWNRASLFWRKVAVVFWKFSQEHSCLPIWYEHQFCFTVSYSTHPSPMFSMFMKLFKQDPQLLGPGHVVLHSWPRISKSFISRPHQVPHIGGGASAPEGRVEKPLPPNRRIKLPSEKEQELRRNHLETLKISGESPNLHFVTCTWHWHWSLQAPRFVNQKRQRWNGDVFIDVGQTQVARMANVAGMGWELQNDLDDLGWLKGAHLHFSFIHWIFLASW